MEIAYILITCFAVLAMFVAVLFLIIEPGCLRGDVTLFYQTDRDGTDKRILREVPGEMSRQQRKETALGYLARVKDGGLIRVVFPGGEELFGA